ncbi:MAG: polyphosphate kinase 1 [Sandaracinaceae bacterium]
MSDPTSSQEISLALAEPSVEAAPRRSLPPPLPAPATDDLSSPELYQNRELTWLSFNRRVLHMAEDPRTPLLERVKFLAIGASTFDEFVMKRIGGLKQQAGARVKTRTVDGRTPEEQLRECLEVMRGLVHRHQELLGELKVELRAHAIVLASWRDLDDGQRETLRAFYVDNVFPLVTPQAMDPAHPFPFVSNLSLNLLVRLRHEERDPVRLMARVKVPVGAGIPRLLRVGDEDVFVPLEEVMAENLDLLFPDMLIEGVDLFRVTRNANTERAEEHADDLLALIETELRDRKFAPIVRLSVERGLDAVTRGFLAAELGLDEALDVVEIDGMLGLADLFEIAGLDRPELKDPVHHPVDHPGFTTDRNIFHIIRDRGSLLVHHPYQSFSTSVERFLREASQDPKVRALKTTIYRTAEDSKVIKHLMEAASNGKQVAVVVELKARFDEEANIRWANRLESVGIHVTYGVVGLKTHCKVILVVRQDFDGLRRYAHLGTGNYHSGTARLYSDVGLFTCDDVLGADLTELFNYLTTGYNPARNFHKLLPAPKVLKPAMLAKIEREASFARRGERAVIQMKMNALEDADVTKALYRASQDGVQVDLLVRDTCRLRAGLPGLSENVRVISIVGRFLEHARIYYFRNGGDEEYYIGSADLMQRNLESRVETLAPVESPDLRAELRYLLDSQLADQVSAWDMKPDGTYVQRHGDGISSQQAFIERAEAQYQEAMRLRRRKTKGVARRHWGR